MGAKPIGIRKRGEIRLEDGQLVGYRDGQEFGRILIGIDGWYFDGMEPTFCQLNDPPAIRLGSRYDDDGNSENRHRGGGKVSFVRIRSDDRSEEEAMIHAGSLDHPTDDRGQIRLKIRQGQGDQDWAVAYVATTEYLGRLWTGAANWLGHLGKHANPGDLPPTPSTGSALRGFYSDDGRWFTNTSQNDGHIVQYDTHHPAFHTSDPSEAAVWTSWNGLLRPLPWV